LEVTLPPPCFSRKTEQPQDEGCEYSDEQQHFKAFGIFRLCVSKRETPSMTFEVAECFFDFHAPCVGALD
jgi:hypothetical protein